MSFFKKKTTDDKPKRISGQVSRFGFYTADDAWNRFAFKISGNPTVFEFERGARRAEKFLALVQPGDNVTIDGVQNAEGRIFGKVVFSVDGEDFEISSIGITTE